MATYWRGLNTAPTPVITVMDIEEHNEASASGQRIAHAAYVATGELIQREGHGTFVRDNKLYASVCGFVERIDKLVSVRPLNARYTAEVGDVVVGRIVEVADKRWRVDVNTRQNGVLMLASIHLPGGVQRRRTHEDSMQMRTFFGENDLISAEVQNILSDGAVALHTRSLKYGKLLYGQFFEVPPVLIKRQKQHFHSLPGTGVDVILGNNGYVWLSATPKKVEDDAEEKDKVRPNASAQVSSAVRERIARVRNSILVLSNSFLPIFSVTIMDVYKESISKGLSAKDLLDPSVWQSVSRVARQRVELSEES